MLGQVLKVLFHVLHLKHHVVEFVLYSDLFEAFYEVFDLHCTLFFSMIDLGNLKELHDLVCPHVLVSLVRLNIFKVNCI